MSDPLAQAQILSLTVAADTALAEAEKAGTLELKITKAEKVIYHYQDVDVLKVHVERARDIVAQALLSQQIEARVALRDAAQGALYRAVYAATPAVAVSNAWEVMSTYPNQVVHGMAGMAAFNREKERAWEIFASTNFTWGEYAGTAVAPLTPKNLKLHTLFTLKKLTDNSTHTSTPLSVCVSE
jgi:hypothetical protein